MNEIQGTHFHDRRIHSNINYPFRIKVSKMRIVGQNNRENLMAAVTACKALDVSDEAIQTCIEKFPGIPHRHGIYHGKKWCLLFTTTLKQKQCQK